MRAHNPEIELSDEIRQKLFELQQKGIDINQLILEMLQKRELEIAQEKEQMSEEMSGKIKTHIPLDEIPLKPSHTFIKVHSGKIPSKPNRYIPIKIKKLLRKEHGNKCSIPNCQKPAEIIHHTQRFSLSRMHDPRYLAPLCRNHHIIAHSIDLKFQQKRKLAMS